MILRALILGFVLCLFTNCAPAPSNTNTANINSVPSPTATATPQQPATATAVITLPLLDALLTDEKFVDQLRSKLKLSNEQIDSLKRVSGEDIARLRAANTEELDSNGNGKDRKSVV